MADFPRLVWLNNCHKAPTKHAANKPAPKRAHTICGAAGNATAVATKTMGLMVGLANMKESAAAGGTPLLIKDFATGTVEHSHPGTRAPAPARPGIKAARGSLHMRRNAVSGTKSAIPAERVTPRTRKGAA
ncbi:hypothetical protein CFL01nite_03770 [Corynebacterium flavescens]|uniref:Transposase n=1 Tax=Corynebacterium flavescens TaxID=28028 RepID=A0AB73B5I0_CORFL|nr:hypothetical protein CFL01nite_03770 [Corynebacterium flavescens]